MPNYPVRRINGVRKRLHVWIAEKALGAPLPAEAVIHHVNNNPLDNRNSNLVICPNQAYHNLIHARTAALDTCGDPNRRPCRWCHQYDDLINLHVVKVLNSFAYWHKECGKLHQRKYYLERKNGKNR